MHSRRTAAATGTTDIANNELRELHAADSRTIPDGPISSDGHYFRTDRVNMYVLRPVIPAGNKHRRQQHRHLSSLLTDKYEERNLAVRTFDLLFTVVAPTSEYIR